MVTVYFMRRKLMRDEGELIEELLSITEKLGGDMQRLTTSDHSGRTSKKIIIEYDIKTKS